MKNTKRTQLKERCVLVTTLHRGVFCGYATKTGGKTLKLRQARLCIYWAKECRGFMGLASMGPTEQCRVGPPADIELRDITSVVEVTPEAATKWALAPWS